MRRCAAGKRDRRSRVGQLGRAGTSSTILGDGVNTFTGVFIYPDGVNTSTLGRMARTQIPRGTRRKPVRLSLVVENDSKRSFDSLAARSGLSGAAFFEAVVAHVEGETTDRGVPSWLPQPEPIDGELPIDAA
jgi:hypothetical protein